MVQVLKEEIKNDLLRHGFESFKTVGYRKTRISAVAKSAGITASTFYNYFESKSIFLNGIFEFWFEKMMRSFFNQDCSVSKTIDVRIREFLTFSWIYLPQQDNLFLMNYLEAFLEFSAKELESQSNYLKQDKAQFFHWFNILMEKVLHKDEVEGIGNMIRHATAGFLLEYKIDPVWAKQEAENSVESFVIFLKSTNRIS